MPGTNTTPYLDDSPRLDPSPIPGGTTGVLTAKWLTLEWEHIDANPAGSLRAFRIVVYTGSDPNDSRNYVVPPVEVPRTYLTAVVPIIVAESTTVSAAIQSVYYNGNESGWRTLVGSVVIDPDTVSLADLAGVTAVQEQLDNITSDDVLSTAEKSYFNLLYTTLLQEQTNIDNQALLYATVPAVGSAKVDYDNALSDLTTYVSALSPAFGDVTQDTPLGVGGGATMRAAFSLVLDTREALLAAVAEQQTGGISDALTSIEGIQNDGVLSRGEKPSLISRYDAATGQKNAAASRALSLGISYADLTAAYNAITDFLAGLLPTPTSWRDTAIDTVLPDTTTLGTLWATFDTELTKTMLAIQSAKRNLDFVIEVPISLTSIPTSVAGGWDSYSEIRDGAKILLAAQTDPAENAVYVSTDTTASGAVNSLPSASAKTGSGTYTTGGLDRNANTADYETVSSSVFGSAAVTYSGWSGDGTAGTLTFVADISNDSGALPASVTVAYSLDGGATWTTFAGGQFDSGVTSHAVTLTAALTGVVQSLLRVRISCSGSRTKAFDPETGIWTYTDTSMSSALLRAVYFASSGSATGKIFTRATNLEQGETYTALYGTRANYEATVDSKSPANELTLSFSPTPATPSAWGTIYGTLADQADLVLQLDRKVNLTGFDDPTAVTVTYNSTNRTITLTGTFVARHKGDIVAALTNGWVSAAHAATSGPWFLYWNGSAFVWSQTAWTFDNLMIAYANYDSVTPSKSFGIREPHGLMDALVHEELHTRIGTYLVSGGDLGGYTLNSTTAAERRPSITATTVKDEDLKSVITALADNGPYTRVTLTGAGTTTFTAGAADIVPLSGNQPYFNEFTGGNWVQTLVPTGDYVSVWLVAVPTTADAGSLAYRYLWFQGQSSEGNLSAARATTFAGMNLGQLEGLFTEFVVIGKVIVRYIGGNWQIVQVDKLTTSRVGSVTTPAGNYLSAVAVSAPLTGSGVAADPLALSYTPINKAGDTGIGALTGTTLDLRGAYGQLTLGGIAAGSAGLIAFRRGSDGVAGGSLGFANASDAATLALQNSGGSGAVALGVNVGGSVANILTITGGASATATFGSTPVTMGALTATTATINGATALNGSATFNATSHLIFPGNGGGGVRWTYGSIAETYSGCNLVMGVNLTVDPADLVANRVKIKSTHPSLGYGAIAIVGDVIKFYGQAGSVTAGDIVTPNIFLTASNSMLTVSTPQTNKGTTLTDGATLSAEILSAAGWTATGWTGDFATGFDHTTGNLTPLSNSTAVAVATKYLVRATVSGRTAGSFTISIGGHTSGGINSTYYFGVAAATTAGLVITPTTDFDGTVVLSLKSITALSNPVHHWTDSTNSFSVQLRVPSSAMSVYLGTNAGRSIPAGPLGTNTGIGYSALQEAVSGYYNTALGYCALQMTTAGYGNTALGHAAMSLNTTGYYNTAVGVSALSNNTTGVYNNAFGVNCLNQNTTGTGNQAIGFGAMQYNTTGTYNVAIGYRTMYGPVGLAPVGDYCNAVGMYALYSSFRAVYNNGFGYRALYNATTGGYNTAMGSSSLDASTTGTGNTAFGYAALNNVRATSGAIASFSDYSATVPGTVKATCSVAHGLTGTSTKVITGTTDYNGSVTITVIDATSFYFTDTFTTTQPGWWGASGEGSNNTAVGYNTGLGITTGSGNTIIGASVTGLSPTLTNNIILASGGIARATFDGAAWNFAAPTTFGTNLLTANKLVIPRNVSAGTGILHYGSAYTAWQTYMTQAGVASGASGTVVAPTGTYVTSWALRSLVESSAGYGWTWESGTITGTTPTIVAELSSATGNFRTIGTVYAAGANLTDGVGTTTINGAGMTVNRVAGYFQSAAAGQNLYYQSDTHNFRSQNGLSTWFQIGATGIATFYANPVTMGALTATNITATASISGASGAFAGGIGIGIGQSANVSAGIWMGTGGLASTSTAQYGIVCTVVPSATATTFTSIYAQTAVPDGGALSNAYAVRILNIAKPGSGTGTVVNNYGIYINAISGGSTGNYALYANAGLTRFADTTAATAYNAASVVISGGLGVAGNIYCASAIFGPNHVADGNSGVAKGIYLRTGNVSRWYINASSSAESGSDAGSPFLLTAYNDAGVGIDVPFAITRAAGGSITLARPTYLNNATVSSGSGTGALIVVGGVGIGGAVFTGSTLQTGGTLTVNTGNLLINAGSLTLPNSQYLYMKDSANASKPVLHMDATNNLWIGPTATGYGAATYLRAGTGINFYTNGAAGSFVASSISAAGALSMASSITSGGFVTSANWLYSNTGTVGGTGGLMLMNASVNRWGLFGNGAESSGNAGSALYLRAYDDAGSPIDYPITIVRAAGGTVTLARPVAIGGPVTVGTGTDHPGGIYKTASRGLTIQGATGSTYDFAIYSPAGSVIASVPTGTTTLNLSGPLLLNSANQSLDRSSNDLRWRYDGTNYGIVLHTKNVGDNAATLQAAVASATAPLVGTVAQRTAYTPGTGTTPYWYATDETAPDGLLGTLRQWTGSAWGAAANPQTVTGRVVAGVISAGAIGTNALAANSVTAAKLEATLIMTSVIRSTGYTAGTSSAAPVGFKLSGSAFTTTYLDSTTDANCFMEIGGSVNIGGYKAAIIANRVRGNNLIWSTPGTYTWTCPEGITSVELLLVAAGGGSAGAVTATRGGGGGGAGKTIKKRITVTPGVTYTIVIGTGGTAGTAGGGAGGVGGNSTFSGSGFTTITMTGGNPGNANGDGGTSGGGTLGGVSVSGVNPPASRYMATFDTGSTADGGGGGGAGSIGLGQPAAGKGGACWDFLGGPGGLTSNSSGGGGGGGASPLAAGGQGASSGNAGNAGSLGSGAGGGACSTTLQGAGAIGGHGYARISW